MDNPFENEINNLEPQQEPVQPWEQPAPPVQPAQPAQEPAPEYLQPQNPFETEPPETPDFPEPPEAPVPEPEQRPPVWNAPPVQQTPPVPPAWQTPPVQPPAPPVQGMQQAPPFAPEQDSFNPIRQTAVYDDNRFIRMPSAPAAPAVPYDAPQQQEKSKVNKGLIVVIIVLSALLGVGLLGIVGYSLMQSKTPSVSSKNESDQVFPIPDFTWPNSGGTFGDRVVPATTAPAEHKESDYSDQANSSFAGLTLADKPADAETSSAYNAEYAFKSASDSVVSVLCFSGDTTDNTNIDSQGSGIVLTADGFIVTNSHVVNDSKTAYAIKVVTADGKEYKAGVVGFDSRTDLAVLKLTDATDLKPAVFGNSEQIDLAEDVIIIGNPGGIDYQNSVTKGIVSAIDRDASSRNMVKYIQTDAPINPGNSGGPAVNMYGQVIGVASAKIVDEKYEGIGFCIPSVQVKQICDTLIRNGYVEGRVKIGITGSAVTSSESLTYGMPRGILVSTIDENGPCGNTELKPDDIITEFDGKPITSFAEMYEALEPHKAGDKAKLKFYRESDKKEYEIEITLQDAKS